MRISKSHDRKSFDCGTESLNKFLREIAREQDSNGKSVTYVATYDEKTVVGYYTLASNHQINLNGIQLRTVLLGKFGVDRRYQGMGMGTYLLMSAARDVMAIADREGIEIFTLDALKETGAHQFYAKFGFEPMDVEENARTLPMYMTIQNIRSIYFPEEE